MYTISSFQLEAANKGYTTELLTLSLVSINAAAAVEEIAQVDKINHKQQQQQQQIMSEQKQPHESWLDVTLLR